MPIMNTGSAEAALRTPVAGMGGIDDENGDLDQLITCPNCQAQFAPGDTDGDAALLAAGGPAATVLPNRGTSTQPVSVDASQVNMGATCAECGGKMEGGVCTECGYSATRSPMREAATKYSDLQPDHARPNVDKVVEQGRRVRDRMRGPSTFGRA